MNLIRREIFKKLEEILAIEEQIEQLTKKQFSPTTSDEVNILEIGGKLMGLQAKYILVQKELINILLSVVIPPKTLH